MKIKIKNITFSWLYLVLIFLILSCIANLPVRNWLDQEIKGETLFLPLDKPLSFEVVPKNNNFNIVVLNFKNPNLASTDRFDVSIANEEKIPIAHQVISGHNIGDPSQVRIQFVPQTNSANKTFQININPQSVSKNVINIGVVQTRDQRFEPYVQLFYRINITPLSFLKLVIDKTIWFMTSDPLFFLSLWGLTGVLALSI